MVDTRWEKWVQGDVNTMVRGAVEEAKRGRITLMAGCHSVMADEIRPRRFRRLAGITDQEDSIAALARGVEGLEAGEFGGVAGFRGGADGGELGVQELGGKGAGKGFDGGLLGGR